MKVNEEIRAQRPEMALQARKSRAKAIRLFCVECMGNNMAEVRRCTVEVCFLWPWRMGGRSAFVEKRVQDSTEADEEDEDGEWEEFYVDEDGNEVPV